MKTVIRHLPHSGCRQMISRLNSPRPLFIDIETTGLSPRFHQIYLIGTALPEEDGIEFRQWLAESPEEEADILAAADRYCRRASLLVHFNGDTFDFPFLRRRMPSAASFRDLPGQDLYQKLRPCRDILRLPDCRLTTLEAFLGFAPRQSPGGGELIPVWHRYTQSREEGDLRKLLRHNEEDVLAMTELIPLLSYPDFLAGNCRILSAAGGSFSSASVLLETDTHFPCPVLLTAGEDREWKILLRDTFLQLTFPVFSGELKYFWENYRDYYYLPEEDMAVHRSVASFVDREFRRKATRETAYIRKTGDYLKSPVFTEGFRHFQEKAGGPLWLCSQDVPFEDTVFWNRYLDGLIPLIRP